MVSEKPSLLHYPRLDTVIMVEETIKSAGEYPSKRQLWLSLKKKVMYQIRQLYISKVNDYYEFYRHQEEGIKVRTLRTRMGPKEREDRACRLSQMQVALLVAA